MRLLYRHHQRTHEVEVTPLGQGRFRVVVDGFQLEVEAAANGEAIDLVDRDRVTRAWVTRDGSRRFVTAPGLGDGWVEKVDAGARPRSARGDDPADLASPMPGRVVKLLVAPGEAVRRGQPLVVVEAMKTEISILAPRDGRIARLSAEPGAMCEAGRPLVELDETS